MRKMAIRNQGTRARCYIQMRKTVLNKSIFKFVILRKRVDLTGEDDKIFNLHLLMAFNFILNLAGRISLSA
ncbi:hypothetical protein T12_9836 [Trichinella patagoniensis]|uniref:Uncharacterized protein n=1 Tax=Trichinella patagoniensis TaxID=990121 RepID=A0A0V0ZR15_9BILA|nr:hypothetical protein T12_13634 [Trichinella patagoniensis]KRY06638.1 hypothetical protein T12_3379 [Trichinella patagoniensis]KRY15136.1 hypothetical protein T12_9836 [Trichinella patagoniensis]